MAVKMATYFNLAKIGGVLILIGLCFGFYEYNKKLQQKLIKSYHETELANSRASEFEDRFKSEVERTKITVRILESREARNIVIENKIQANKSALLTERDTNAVVKIWFDDTIPSSVIRLLQKNN